MVTLDRIRLTGLLRKEPRYRGALPCRAPARLERRRRREPVGDGHDTGRHALCCVAGDRTGAGCGVRSVSPCNRPMIARPSLYGTATAAHARPASAATATISSTTSARYGIVRVTAVAATTASGAHA